MLSIQPPDPSQSDGSAANSNSVPNLDLCAVCGRSGQLVCCDYCPRSYHRKCLNGMEVPKGMQSFICFRCRSGSYGFSMNDLDLNLHEDLLRFVEVFCVQVDGNCSKPSLGAMLQYLEISHPDCTSQIAPIVAAFVNSDSALRQGSEQVKSEEKVATSARSRQLCLNLERVVGQQVCSIFKVHSPFDEFKVGLGKAMQVLWAEETLPSLRSWRLCHLHQQAMCSLWSNSLPSKLLFQLRNTI